MADWRIDVGEEISTGLHFDEPSVACWLGTASGRLLAVRLIGPRVLPLGSGWPDAVAVFPAAEGLGVAVVTSPGEVWLAPRAGADRDFAVRVAVLPAAAKAAALAPGGHLLVLGEDGAVSAVAVADNAATVEPLPAAVPGALAIAVNPAAGTFTLLAPAGAGSELHTFDLAGVSAGPAVGTADAGVAIASPPPGVAAALAALLTDSGAVETVLDDGTGMLGGASFPGATAAARWHSLMLVASAGRLELHEWGTDPAPALAVSGSLDPLIVGGWGPLTVDYASAGLGRSDVEWRVAEGPAAGSVSVASASARAGGVHDHRLLAGVLAGEIHVEAVNRHDGAVLATHLARVVRAWPDNELGPPMVATGERRLFAKGGWGGGPNTPQNIRAHPAPEEFRVAMVVFRTKGAKSVVDVGQRRTQLTQDMVGVETSVKRYYEEVSYRSTPASANPAHPKGTTVSLAGGEVFGPVDLDFAWGELFTPGDPKAPFGAWDPLAGTWDLLGGAFSTFVAGRDAALIDKVLRAIDAVVLAVLPGTDDPVTVGTEMSPAQWSWASASDTQIHWQQAGLDIPGVKRIPAVIMPAAFPANHPAPWEPREWVSTICHELGHNLGCPDLYKGDGYPAEIADRYLDGWELMSQDSPLPHFSLAHRMRLGWIDPGWVESIDFGGTPASRSVTLQAIETVPRSGPEAGSRAGVEIRIRDGWNYYFEYRRGQASQIGDRRFGAAAVLGTDVHLAAAQEYARPLILKLPVDVDGDGPVLTGASTDYEESDTTNPERMFDFRVTRGPASFFDPTQVKIQIDYVGAHRAQLQISPAPGRGDFKSPDIDLDGPAGPNRVAKGLVNTITFRVRNAGTKDAKSVRARVRWLPFTTAAGDWVELPDPPRQDIPAHATRTFTLPWAPPLLMVLGEAPDVGVEHFCVRVDIDRYIDPLDASGSEIVVSDNWAQSNFTTDGIGHGSPSERKATALTGTNTLPFAATYRTWLDQSSRFFRAYLDHAWHRLRPGQTAVTQLAYESLAGDPLHGREFEQLFTQTLGEAMRNDLSAQTMALGEGRRDGPIERGGVQLILQAGLRTLIVELRGNSDVADGMVVAGDDRRPVERGGAVRVVGWPARRPEEQAWREGFVKPDGTFRVLVDQMLPQVPHGEEVVLRAYYLGAVGYAPCRSKDVSVVW